MDLARVANCLRFPPRTPAYRRGRVHEEFLTNLPLATDTVASALHRAWGMGHAMSHPPLELAKQLATARYEKDSWNFMR
jgi:hypothetical protein